MRNDEIQESLANKYLPPSRQGEKGSGYHCPSCKYTKTIVLDSRPNYEGFTRRRRRCPSCGHKFSTLEICIGVNTHKRIDYQQYENLSSISRQIIRLTMDVLTRAEK